MRTIEINPDSLRVETGAVQFNDDWPGVFVRGDNAFFFSLHLKAVLKQAKEHPELFDFIAVNTLENLVDLFNSCVIVSSEEDNDVGC